MVTREELRAAQAARQEAFCELAKQLPSHRLLGVEVIRISDERSAAVVTAVVDGRPRQYVLRGDASGAVLARAERSSAPDEDEHEDEHEVDPADADDLPLEALPARGEPPPGIVAVASAALAATLRAAPVGG